MKGWVYVLTNPCMPGIVKIGKTTRDPDGRANELYTTGVPMPFRVCRKILTLDANRVEADAHRGLSEFRINSSREFFSCSPSDAFNAIVMSHVELVSDFLSEYLPMSALVAIPDSEAANFIRSMAKDIGEDPDDAIRSIPFLKKEWIKESIAALVCVESNKDVKDDDEEGHYQ